VQQKGRKTEKKKRKKRKTATKLTVRLNLSTNQREMVGNTVKPATSIIHFSTLF